MHEVYKPELLSDDLFQNSTPVKSGYNLKEHMNKGYSFPRYISKYKGFVPGVLQHHFNNVEITSKDIRRILGYNNENMHNYFMEYQKDHFYSLKLCNFKVIERILLYYETNLTPSEKETSSVSSNVSTNASSNISSSVSSNASCSICSSNGYEKENYTNIIKKNSSKIKKDCVLVNEIPDKIIKDCHYRLRTNERSSFLKSTEVSSYAPVDLKYKIDLEDVASGKDKRTTCMIKNIPNKYTQQMLIDLLNEHHFGCYDFVYLRMDFKNKCNVGYAFVNLIDSKCIISLYKKINNKGWKKFFSNKIAQVTYASIQSLDNLKRKFRKSSVMQEQESYRPKIFYSEGPLKGYEQTDF